MAVTNAEASVLLTAVRSIWRATRWKPSQRLRVPANVAGHLVDHEGRQVPLGQIIDEIEAALAKTRTDPDSKEILKAAYGIGRFPPKHPSRAIQLIGHSGNRSDREHLPRSTFDRKRSRSVSALAEALDPSPRPDGHDLRPEAKPFQTAWFDRAIEAAGWRGVGDLALELIRGADSEASIGVEVRHICSDAKVERAKGSRSKELMSKRQAIAAISVAAWEISKAAAESAVSIELRALQSVTPRIIQVAPAHLADLLTVQIDPRVCSALAYELDSAEPVPSVVDLCWSIVQSLGTEQWTWKEAKRLSEKLAFRMAADNHPLASYACRVIGLRYRADDTGERSMIWGVHSASSAGRHREAASTFWEVTAAPSNTPVASWRRELVRAGIDFRRALHDSLDGRHLTSLKRAIDALHRFEGIDVSRALEAAYRDGSVADSDFVAHFLRGAEITGLIRREDSRLRHGSLPPDGWLELAERRLVRVTEPIDRPISERRMREVSSFLRDAA